MDSKLNNEYGGITSPTHGTPLHEGEENTKGRKGSKPHLKKLAIATSFVFLFSIGSLGFSSTLALPAWLDSATQNVPNITNGSLSVNLGSSEWNEVTPLVAAPASGDSSDIGDFVGSEGDVIQITTPFEYEGIGDNLVVDVALEVDELILDPALKINGWKLINSDESAQSPAVGFSDVSDTLRLPTNADPQDDNYSLVVEVEWVNEATFVTHSNAVPEPRPLVSLPYTLNLRQVRE